MSTQVENATQILREAILSGTYGAGEKLKEVHIAASLGVSRTVIRLALSSLELEGLVAHTPNRGFRTKRFTLDEVSDAIILRGEIEAIAARCICEKGISDANVSLFRDLLDSMKTVLASGFSQREARLKWMELVAEFHALIVSASGNTAIHSTIAHLSRIPLVAPHSVVFDLSSEDFSLERVKRTYETRVQLVEALIQRQGGHAAALMIGYAHQACRNKRASVEGMRLGKPVSAIPGLGLISRSEER